MEITIYINSNLGGSLGFGYEDFNADYKEADVYFDMQESFYENYYQFDASLEKLREDLNRLCTDDTDDDTRFELARKIVVEKANPITVEIIENNEPSHYEFPYNLKTIFTDMIANDIYR